MEPGAIAKMLVEYGPWGIAAIEGYVIKRLFDELMKAKGETLDVATQVLPVSEKLAQGVEALERMDARRDCDE